MTKNKLFWGIILIALAVVLLLYAFLPDFSLGGISFWQIVAGGALIYWLINNIFFGETLAKRLNVFFPLALLFIVFEKNIAHLIGKPDNLANNWVVLIAGILLTVAVHLLCGKKKPNVTDSSGVKSGKMAESIIYIDVLTQNSESVKNTFGEMNIYFQNTDADTATSPFMLMVNNSFGELAVHVPENWAVNNCVDNSLGTVEAGINPANPVRTLILQGKNSFGEVSICR